MHVNYSTHIQSRVVIRCAVTQPDLKGVDEQQGVIEKVRDVLSNDLHSREIHRRQAGAKPERVTGMHDHGCAAQMMRGTCVSTEVCSQLTNHYHSRKSPL
jgi:hypothetical protein